MRIRKEEKTHPADWVKKRERPYFCQNQAKKLYAWPVQLKGRRKGKRKEKIRKERERKGKRKRLIQLIGSKRQWPYFCQNQAKHCIITALFVGCKQGGRTQNVSYSFDPPGRNPRGTAICMLGPSQVQKQAP